MNIHIISSEPNDDDDVDSFIDDLKPVSYEGELQRLKCENFQLRLSCYNYECTINQIENDTKDNEVSILKQSYEQKIQSCHLIENRMKLVEKENMNIKEKLNEYSTLEARRSPHDNESQISLPCTFCDDSGLVLKRTIDEFAQKITELEDENLRLQNFLFETKSSIIKKEIGCNTELDTRNALYNTDSLTDFESDSSSHSPLIQLPLETLFQSTLTKINDFLSKYKTGEMKIRNLEMDMVSVMEHNCPSATITDDHFKMCLFKDQMVTADDKYINAMIQKCRVQLINSDQQQMDTLISDCEEDCQEDLSVDTMAFKNPNILAINSILEKLNKRNKSIQILKKKMKMNKTWNKHVSIFKQMLVENELQRDIKEDMGIYIEQISELTTQLTTMIPAVQLTFEKSMDHIKSARQFQGDRNYASMVDYHQHNERVFLDNCNMFIQSTSNCLLALNKEKWFLNSACQLFSVVSAKNGGQHVIRGGSKGPPCDEDVRSTAYSTNDKTTSVDLVMTCHVLCQTSHQPSIPQQNMRVIHRSIQTILPENDCRNYFRETSPSSQRSTDTFIIDEYENDNDPKDRPRSLRACGDVISDEVPIKLVELKKREKYISENCADTKRFFQGCNARRCISLDNLKNDGEVAVQLDPSLSLNNLNNSNMNHNSCFYHEIFNIKDDTASSSVSQSNIHSSSTKILRTFSAHSSQMTFCSLSQWPRDANGSSGIVLPHLKQRIMKLVYVHDCRAYFRALSDRDVHIAEQLSTIDKGPTKCDICSKLSLDLRTDVERWKKEVSMFRDAFLKCSVLSTALLISSDAELVQSLFIKRESTLDLVIPDGDLYKNDTTMFASLKGVIKETAQSYGVLDKLHENILEKFLFLRVHGKDLCLSNPNSVSNELQRKKCQLSNLEKRSEELLDQIRGIRIENEKLRIELNRETCARNSLQEIVDKTVEDKDNMSRENKTLTREKEDKSEELCMLQMEIRIHEENSQIHKDVSSKLLESESICRSLEQENIVLKEHERQLLNTLVKREEKIVELTTEMGEKCVLLKEKENELNHEISVLENTMKLMSKDSIECKERVHKLEEEGENKFNLLLNERAKNIELKLKCQSVEEELRDSVADLSGRDREMSLKLREMENVMGCVEEVKEKFDCLSSTIIDLVLKMNSTMNKDPLVLQCSENLARHKNDVDATKNLGVISATTDVLLRVLEQQIKMSDYVTGQAHFSNEDKGVQVNIKTKIEERTSRDNYEKPSYREFIERRQHHDRSCLSREGDSSAAKSKEGFLKSPARNSMVNLSPYGVQIDSNLKVMTLDTNEKFPIPAPRQKSKNPIKAFVDGQANENNVQSMIYDPTICEEDRDEYQDEDADQSRDNTSQMLEHLSLPMDAKDGKQCRKLMHGHGMASVGLLDTSSVIQTLLVRLSRGISSQYTREFRELCHEIKLIELDNSAPSSGTVSDFDRGSMEKLIDTNRSLTSNLMETTKKLLGLQDKVEVLNSEVRQGQVLKHEMSTELASKYQQVSQMQYQLENIKRDMTRPTGVEQSTQTSGDPPFENVKATNSLHISDPELEQRENMCSRQSSNTISKSEDISQFTKSNNIQDRPDNDSHNKHYTDGGWDDVTRTMIRCLTTLSEVQESLVSPPPGDDPLMISSDFHTLSCEADSNTNGSIPGIEKCRSSAHEIVRGSDRVRVAVMREAKYQSVRQILLKIKDYCKIINENKTQKLEVSKTSLSLVQVERSVLKINGILVNNIVVRELSRSDWQSFLDGTERHHNYPLNVTVTNVCPANNPLDATERVQSDIVRLQQRLERYQCRYKSLKNAVMANKYRFIGSDVGSM